MFSLLVLISITVNYVYPAVAESLYAHKDYYNAATEYERILFYNITTDDSTSAAIKCRLAHCYYETGERERAEPIISHLLERQNRTCGQAQLLRVDYYLREKEYFRAKVELSDILLFANNESVKKTAYCLLGYIALQEHQERDAIKYFTIAQDTFLTNRAEALINTPKKNPSLSQIMSSILPGSGEIYAGKYSLGIWSLFINSACVYGIIHSYQKKQYLDATLIFLFLFTRFYNGSRNNAQYFTVKYNERKLGSKIKEIQDYLKIKPKNR